MSAEIPEGKVLSKGGLLALAFLAVAACANNTIAPSAPSPASPSAPPPPQAPPAPAGLDPTRSIRLSPPQLESLKSAAREAAEQRKRERKAWIGSSPEKWRSAIESYVSSVRPGNQTALGTAATPFAYYLDGMHKRIHPLFSDFLDSLDDRPATYPLNEKHLITRVEIVLTGDGRIKRMGVVRTSGVAEFDGAVLDAVDRAQPFRPTPSAILSADGNVYVQWEFRRDEVYGCSTMNARPFILVEPANAP